MLAGGCVLLLFVLGAFVLDYMGYSYSCLGITLRIALDFNSPKEHNSARSETFLLARTQEMTMMVSAERCLPSPGFNLTVYNRMRNLKELDLTLLS